MNFIERRVCFGGSVEDEFFGWGDFWGERVNEEEEGGDENDGLMFLLLNLLCWFFLEDGVRDMMRNCCYNEGIMWFVFRISDIEIWCLWVK